VTKTSNKLNWQLGASHRCGTLITKDCVTGLQRLWLCLSVD